MRALLASLLLLLPFPAFACDIAEALIKHAYPDAVAADGGYTVKGSAYVRRIDPRAVACKTWPYRPELTLAAVPLSEAAPANEGEVRGDVEVMAVDTATGEPVARLVEEGMAFADAVQFDDVSLDTARYDLKPGLRAFGVKVTHSGSSRIFPYADEVLRLYTLQGATLVRVLDGLIVSVSTNENDGNCNGVGETTSRSITLGQPGRGGYRDLRIDEKRVAETTRDMGSDCVSTSKPLLGRSHVLRFGGQGYEIPKGVKPEDRLFDLGE